MKVVKGGIDPGWLRIFLVACALVAAVAAGLAHVAGPAPGPGGAAPGAFSSGRALEHLRHIARTPHATGTAANAEVRAYLVAQLRAQGLEPEVQSGVGIAQASGAAGYVHNVIARLPGRQPGPALMLAAHYDSAPTSPGAADDGASVAAILETLRALRAGPRPRHDVVVLLTDGEEPGLLGARLFTARHPLARQVGVVLNFEYRGNSGPVWMFETSSGNGALVRAWRAAAPAPLGNSLLSEVYKRMPNGTDLSVFRQAGMQGLNFAAIGGHTSYHTGLDTVDRLDPGTLQRQGDTMLALARHFADLGAAAPAADQIYMDVPLVGVLAYPAAWAIPLAAVVLLLFGATVVLGRRRAGVRLGAVAAAVPLFAAQVAIVAAACQWLWAGLRLLHPGYRLMLHGEPYNANWYLAAFALLAMALFLALSKVLQRWFAVAELAIGALACWALLTVAAAVLLPGGSFLLTWPTLFALLALLAVFRREPSAAAQAGWLALGAVLAVLVVTPILPALAGAATLSAVWVPVAALAMLLGLAAPAVAVLGRLRLPLAAALAGAACLAGGALSAGFDAVHPRPYSLFYLADGDSGKALWLAGEEQPEAWTQRYLAGAERRQLPALYGPGGPQVWAAPAPAGAVPAPEVRIVADRSDGADRHLVLELRSPRGAPRLSVAVDGAPVLAASIAGEPFSPQPRATWKANLHGFGRDGVRVALRLPRDARFRLRVTDVSYDLAASGLTGRRPAALLAQPFGSSETIQALRTVSFNPDSTGAN